MCGAEIQTLQRQQLSLPIELGGFTLPLISERAGPAFIAAIQVWPIILNPLARLQREHAAYVVQQLGGLQLEAEIKDLQAQGVTISACASVHTFTDDILATPIAPLSSGHLLDLEPVSILGQIEQAKQGLALQKLLGASAAQPREVMRILASAEPLAVHMPWRAIPDANDVVVSDSAFSAFTRWRLGLPLCSEAAQCGRVADKGIQATQCGKSLGGRDDHITLCRLGASASGTHSAFAELVKTAAKEAGMLALREVVIPAWPDGSARAQPALAKQVMRGTMGLWGMRALMSLRGVLWRQRPGSCFWMLPSGTPGHR